MESKRTHEELKEILDRNTAWIENCDSKTSIIFCFFAISLILAGCICWITALFARVNLNEFSNRGIKSDSLIFFSSIARHQSLSSYKQKLKKCKTSQMEDDLISQIYICSIICDKKFKYYKLGLLLASTGLILFVVLFVIGLVV